MFVSLVLFSIVLEVLVNVVRWEKLIININIGKEE